MLALAERRRRLRRQADEIAEPPGAGRASDAIVDEIGAALGKIEAEMAAIVVSTPAALIEQLEILRELTPFDELVDNVIAGLRLVGKTPRRANMSDEPAYLFKMPATVPPGRVLVHNQVRPARRLGTRGFRAWLSLPDPTRLAKCSCGWAPELGEHYRVIPPPPSG